MKYHIKTINEDKTCAIREVTSSSYLGVLFAAAASSEVSKCSTLYIIDRYNYWVNRFKDTPTENIVRFFLEEIDRGFNNIIYIKDVENSTYFYIKKGFVYYTLAKDMADNIFKESGLF